MRPYNNSLLNKRAWLNQGNCASMCKECDGIKWRNVLVIVPEVNEDQYDMNLTHLIEFIQSLMKNILF